MDQLEALTGIAKSPTGIDGLDDVTRGGLPSGRPTLVCGGPGCGKTLFAASFLVHGARELDEPGLFVSFEERPEDIVQNVASLGFDLDRLIAEEKLAIEHIAVDSADLAEVGEYDLDGIFIRLEMAVDQIGARRIVLDTVESLFSAFSNEAILRAEIRRLFDWIRGRGLTAVITGEQGERTLTRYGLEEYVSDCVILLDHRVRNQTSTRRLRIVKYRGTSHGTNEYPFLIDENGFSVLPVSTLGLDHAVTDERVSSGIADLDAMIQGGGFYRGSSILVSGVAGAGKSMVAAHFVDAACKNGERALYFSFEESAEQIVRNMRSVGLSLGKHIDEGRLRYRAARPTLYGLEMHLAIMMRDIAEFRPSLVVLDPVSAFTSVAEPGEVEPMLLRVIDYLKGHGITAVLTNLTQGNLELAQTDIGMSSLMDAWLLLLNREASGEYNRELYILKARGLAHSNQVREFLITGSGVSLREPYLGSDGALTGSARVAQEARDRAAATERDSQMARRKRQAEARRRALTVQLEALQAELEDELSELRQIGEEEQAALEREKKDSMAIARSRRAGQVNREKN